MTTNTNDDTERIPTMNDEDGALIISRWHTPEREQDSIHRLADNQAALIKRLEAEKDALKAERDAYKAFYEFMADMDFIATPLDSTKYDSDEIGLWAEIYTTIETIKALQGKAK